MAAGLIGAQESCYSMSRSFWTLGDLCMGIPFVKQLADTFYWSGDKARELGDAFRETNMWVENTIITLRDILSIDTWWKWLEDHYSEIYYLFVDPIGQVKRWIGLIMGLEPRDMDSGSLFIKALIQKHLHVLWDFYVDPWGAIRRRIDEHLDTFQHWMGNILGLTPYEINYPERWIEYLIDKHLPTLYRFWKSTLPEFSSFFQDPRDSIRLWMANLLNLSPYEANYPERWIEYIICKAFPAWPQFRDDPGRYITEQVITYIEERVPDLYERVGELALEILARLLGV